MVFHALMFEGGSGEPKADQGFQYLLKDLVNVNALN